MDLKCPNMFYFLQFQHSRHSTLIQESEGPYAWRGSLPCQASASRGGQRRQALPNMERSSSKSGLGDEMVYPNGPRWCQCLSSDLLARPSLQSIVREARAMQCISFKLPSLNAVAGGVLKHALKTMDGLIAKEYPLIFKVGFTHNCAWRWGNSLYGYCMSVDNWSDMLVMHIAGEPYSVAMLEAALIQTYQSTSHGPFLYIILCVYMCVESIQHINVSNALEE